MSDNSLTPQAPRLIPLVSWPRIHGHPSIGTLRHLVFFKKTNGFDKVIRYIGKRVYIHEADFFTWVDQQTAKEAGKHT